MAGARVAWTRRRPPVAGRVEEVCEPRCFFWQKARAGSHGDAGHRPQVPVSRKWSELCSQSALCPHRSPSGPSCDHSILQPRKQAPQAK